MSLSTNSGVDVYIDGEYYSQNIEELATELEENVFPQLEGVLGWGKGEGKLIVSIAEEDFAASRSAILRYFDAELFEFIME